MPTITKVLTYTEVTYGLLLVKDLMKFLPAPGQGVTIIDEDGENFKTHMHRSQPRIDGLKKLIVTKHNSNIGDKVTISVEIGKIGEVKTVFEAEHKLIQQEESDNISSESNEESYENRDLLITPSLESMLEDFILNNLSSLEYDLELYKDSDGIEGRQYNTGVGIIDLLCKDKDNNLVVIEIKKGRESDRVVGQISRYIGWAQKNLTSNNQKVRGIVVIHKPTSTYPKDDKLYYAVLSNPNIELRYYEIKLNFYDRGSEF